MVAADSIEHSAGFEISLRGCNHIHARPVDRLNHRIAEQAYPRDRQRCLKVTQVIRRIETVERAFAELVKIQVMLLLGIIMRREDVYAGPRRRAHDVIYDAAEPLKLF